MRLDKQKLEVARARRNMTLDGLRKAAKCSTNSIRKGYQVDIDPSVIGRIAGALEVDVTEIIQAEA